MVITKSTVTFSNGDELKQTNLGKHLHDLEFPAYPTDISLCIVDVMKEYLERIYTKPLRGSVVIYLLLMLSLTKQPAKILYLGGLRPP